jgi:hypothetical protein
MRHFIIFFITSVLLISTEAHSQQSLLQLGVWNVSALSGELKLGALHGQGDINTYGIKNRLTTTNYYGGILVKSNSFIWNPNFLTVSIDGGYYPESRQDLYLVSPNIYNVINTSKLHIGTVLFPKKLITLSTHLNFDNSYDSRENLTDIKTNSKAYGGTFSYRNKFLPLTLAYNQSDWDSREILSGRDFSYKQKNVEGRVTKTFGKRDKNDLSYTHNDYLRRDYSLAAIRNISDNLELLDGFFLDSTRRSYYNSNILGTVQRGNDSFRQFRASENLFYKMQHNFTFNTSYNYSYINRPPEELQQHNFSALLGHQLFESLHSGLLYEYNNSLESTYRELNNKVGVDLNYTKKTFADGLLNIQYAYNLVFEKRNSSDAFLNILNEEYTVSDRVLLKRPYVIQSSLIIKDVTGTIIYQEGIDYTLTAIGNFIEIQRIPGGQISNNAKIYVFYTANQPGSYSYDVSLNNISFNYSIFKQLLDVYFKENRSDYSHIHNADNLLLNYLIEDIYGAGIKYRSVNGGAEYDNYQSTLVPYVMTHYFLTWQGRYKQTILFSVYANWRDYKIPTETTHRIYRDINGMFSYAFSRRSKFDLNVGYQTQQGRQINLNLITGRAKFSTLVKDMTMTIGVETYDRVYLDNQQTNYMGAYIQIVKKFKY